MKVQTKLITKQFGVDHRKKQHDRPSHITSISQNIEMENELRNIGVIRE
jgi:hypothetical protein